MNRARVLITGFEPFEGHRLNASWEIARALAERAGPGEDWIAACLPCAFEESSVALARLLHEHEPDCVIALGQAEGRAEITIERIAINVRDARIPDNRGAQPVDQPVVADAPLAYLSTLPVRHLLNALRQQGRPVSLSNTAGTYVCNEVFFSLQHQLRERGIPSGFVHVPILPEQRNTGDRRPERTAREDAPVDTSRATPTLDFEVQRAALEALIRLTLQASGGRG